MQEFIDVVPVLDVVSLNIEKLALLDQLLNHLGVHLNFIFWGRRVCRRFNVDVASHLYFFHLLLAREILLRFCELAGRLVCHSGPINAVS